jgi:large subunit ribosomal protein L4e
MKVKVITTTKVEKASKEMPVQFMEQIRPDLIKRAFHAIQSHNRQPYGADPEAGKKHSTKLSRRRRKYRGSYGHGISRVPRKILTRRGTRFYWVGAFAPGTVGGRRAHPPKADKNWNQKINVKEKRKAIRSAMAATLVKDIVANRGHKVPELYPFIVEDKIESFSKTKQVKQALEKLGLKDDLLRSLNRTIKSGIAKMRGRKYRVPSGPLLVVGKDCPLLRSGNNIPGVSVVNVQNLNVELLAPGADYGRLTVFTESAIEKIKTDNLFMPSVKKIGKKSNSQKNSKKSEKKSEKTKASKNVAKKAE